MPDVREVFEMVRQQTEPDLDSWREQERRMRQAARKRKIGALALVAALLVGLAFFALRELRKLDSSVGPATHTSSGVRAFGPGFTLVDVATGTLTGTGIVPGASEVDATADGTKITYANEDIVWIANADGSGQQWFDQTHSPGGATAPRWSPDGTKIVYQGLGAGDQIGNLFVLDVASGHVHQITHLGPMVSGLYYMAPAFSADGRSVLFTQPTAVADPDGSHVRWDIRSVPAGGGDSTLVVPNAIAADPQPGGNLIAYSRADGPDDVHDVYIARSDGSNPRKVVDGQIWLPRWSPDGSKIGYSDGGLDGLFVLDLATGETNEVMNSAEWPEWVDMDTMMVDLSD